MELDEETRRMQPFSLHMLCPKRDQEAALELVTPDEVGYVNDAEPRRGGGRPPFDWGKKIMDA